MRAIPRYNYIAIDPGNTTGIATLDRHGRLVTSEPSATRAIDTVEEIADAYMRYGSDVVIAVERANVNSNKGGRGILRGLRWEMEVIGCARHFARKYRHNFAEYNKSDAAHVATNELLRQIGWWHVGGGGHANDAMRILAMAVREHDLDYWHQLMLDKGVLTREERHG